MMVRLGEVVEFVDATGRARPAMVTAIWGRPAASTDREARGRQMVTASADDCSLNLVFVSLDENRYDIHGRQLERALLVVHESQQQAPGMFWRHVNARPTPLGTDGTLRDEDTDDPRDPRNRSRSHAAV